MDFVISSLKTNNLKEGDVLAITSKIVSLSENQICFKSAIKNKKELIQREADVYLGESLYNHHITIKHNLLIPAAGIDESNTDGEYYILYPKNPYLTAQNICKSLKKYYKLKKLGVILTDSHSTPLHRGVTGVSLAHWGFRGIESLVGQKDIFGRKLKFTHLNHADAIANMAVYFMGEANQKNPLAVIKNLNLKFTNLDVSKDIPLKINEDIYLSLLLKNLN